MSFIAGNVLLAIRRSDILVGLRLGWLCPHRTMSKAGTRAGQTQIQLEPLMLSLHVSTCGICGMHHTCFLQPRLLGRGAFGFSSVPVVYLRRLDVVNLQGIHRIQGFIACEMCDLNLRNVCQAIRSLCACTVTVDECRSWMAWQSLVWSFGGRAWVQGALAPLRG